MPTVYVFSEPHGFGPLITYFHRDDFKHDESFIRRVIYYTQIQRYVLCTPLLATDYYYIYTCVDVDFDITLCRLICRLGWEIVGVETYHASSTRSLSM